MPRAYVNNPRGVDVVDDDFVIVSSIYDWYVEDFRGTEESVIEHLIDYADGELAAFLEGFEGAIEYGYDWSLNEPQRTALRNSGQTRRSHALLART